MSRTYHVLCLSEALGPISHMAAAAGNEGVVAREPVVTPRGVLRVPYLSGNSLRHRCVREPGWRWLIERYDLAGKLSLVQLNWCLHGGNLTEGGGREDTRRIAGMQRLLPLARLLGGCLPDQIIAGSLLAGRGRLVCEENREHLKADVSRLGWELPDAPLRPAEAFVSDGRQNQYTRGDGRKSASALLAETNGEPAESNLMIFSGQAVARGACFLHTFTLQHVSDLEFGALLWSLRLWQAAGGTVGGHGARGHGRLSTAVHCDADADAAVGAYLAHVDAVKDDAVAWLTSSFAAGPGRPARGKKAGEAAT